MRLARRSAPTALVKAEDLTLAATTEQEQSFVALYEILYPRLCDFAARFLGRDGAYDAVQQAMCDIWSRWPLVAIDRPSISFYRRQTMGIVMRGLETAFAHFGGVPRELLFDQLKAVIVDDERRSGGKVLENPEFLSEVTDVRCVVRSPARSRTHGGAQCSSDRL